MVVVYWCLMDGPVCIHLRLVGTCMSPNQPDNKSVRRRDAPGVVLEEELADLRLERPEAHAVLRLLLVVGVFVWICWLVGGGVCVRLISKGLSREGRLGGDRTIYWSQPTRPQHPTPPTPPQKTNTNNDNVRARSRRRAPASRRGPRPRTAPASPRWSTRRRSPPVYVDVDG